MNLQLKLWHTPVACLLVFPSFWSQEHCDLDRELCNLSVASLGEQEDSNRTALGSGKENSGNTDGKMEAN